MRFNLIERLEARGAIHAIGMGGGLGNDRGGGGAHGGNHGVGNGNSNKGRGGGGGGNKSMNGRGGQNDVNGRNSPTGDSADNGSHQGRQSDADRRRTNPMAASRQADATGELSTQDLDARRSDRFSHARQAMTVDDKHEAASLATSHVNRNTDKLFDGVGVVGGLMGLGPAAPTASNLGKSLYNASTKGDMLGELGVNQTTGDMVAETARGFIPSTVGMLAAPAGAMLGGSLLGSQTGAMLGAKGVKSGVTAGLESQMTRENMNGTTANTAINGGNGNAQQPSSANSIASVAQPSGSAVDNARSAFGYAEIETDNYSKGLLNAKV